MQHNVAMPARKRGGLLGKLKAAASSIGSSLSEVVSSDSSGGIRPDSSSSSQAAGKEAKSVVPVGGSPARASSSGLQSPAPGHVRVDVAGSASEAETVQMDDQYEASADLCRKELSGQRIAGRQQQQQ